MVFSLLEMTKTLMLLIVFTSFNGILNAKQNDQTRIKKAEAGTTEIVEQTKQQNNLEKLNIEKLKQNQSCCEHKMNNTGDNFPGREALTQVTTSLLGTNVKINATDEIYIKITNKIEKENATTELQNNSNQNSELDDAEAENVRDIAHPPSNGTIEGSATNIELKAVNKSEELYQTMSFVSEYPHLMKSDVVNNENLPEKQNYWIKRITDPDPVDKEIKQILNYLPKLPELTFSDNKSHFEFHKDPEESALDERITQIARQLAETNLRREFEEKKLGHYISIRLANFDDDHQSRSSFNLSKKSNFGKSYKIPTEFFPKNTQKTIIMPLPLTRRFEKQQFQSRQSTTVSEKMKIQSERSSETDSNKAFKTANDKYHPVVTDIEVLPVSFYLRFKYSSPTLNNLERYNILFAYMNTHRQDR